MAFVPLIAAAGIAAYSVGMVQSNLDAKNLWKNTVNGINNNSNGSKSAHTPWYGVKPPPGTFAGTPYGGPLRGPEDWEAQSKHPLPLNAIDNINVKIQEFNSQTKIKRKSVPTIPGVTKDLPYTTFGMANNPSKF